VEGAHGVGRALAQRLVGAGEQVLDVPAKLAARVRVLSVGHGRKRDPDDAVSVAVAARSAPRLRQVGVEDQAVVLHLLTKRREDLVAAHPDHQPPAPAADSPGPRRRQTQPHRQPGRRPAQ
jgi:transposase